MENVNLLFESYPWLLPLIIITGVWDAVWRLVALWSAARNGQKAWFICLALISSVGILPLTYLVKFKKSQAVS